MNQNDREVTHNITFSDDLLDKFKLQENKTYTLSIKFLYKNNQATILDDYVVEEYVEDLNKQTKKFNISELIQKTKKCELINQEKVINTEIEKGESPGIVCENLNNEKNTEVPKIVETPKCEKNIKVPKTKENQKIKKILNQEKITEVSKIKENKKNVENLNNEKNIKILKIEENLNNEKNEEKIENRSLTNTTKNVKLIKQENEQSNSPKKLQTKEIISIPPKENFNVANQELKCRLIAQKELRLKEKLQIDPLGISKCQGTEHLDTKIVLRPNKLNINQNVNFEPQSSPKRKTGQPELEIIKISDMTENEYSIIKGVVVDYLGFKKSLGSDYMCTVTLCDDFTIKIRHFCNSPDIGLTILPGDVIIINKVKKLDPYSITYKRSKFILKYNCLFTSLFHNESMFFKKAFLKNNLYLKQIFQIQNNTKGDFIGIVLDSFINSFESTEILMTDFTTSSLINEKREIKGIKNTKLISVTFKINRQVYIKSQDVIYLKNIKFTIEGHLIKAYFYSDSTFIKLERKDIIAHFNEHLIPKSYTVPPTPKLINTSNSDTIYKVTSRIKELKRINTTIFCINCKCKSELCTSQGSHNLANINSYKVKLSDYKSNCWFMTMVSEIEMYDRGELLEFYIAKLAYKTLKVEHILAVKLGKEENIKREVK